MAPWNKSFLLETVTFRGFSCQKLWGLLLPETLGASPARNFGGFSCQKLSGRRRQKETQESSGGVAHRSLGNKKSAGNFLSRRNGDPGERCGGFNLNLKQLYKILGFLYMVIYTVIIYSKLLVSKGFFVLPNSIHRSLRSGEAERFFATENMGAFFSDD